MDSSISPDTEDMGDNGADEMSEDMELCVPAESLAIDGTIPAVGDHVNVKVGGDITRVVNGQAYVKVITVNDQPLPAPNIKPNPAVDEGTRLQRLSDQYGGLNS